MTITEHKYDDDGTLVTFAKYKPLEWFEENGFIDHDGDYWQNKLQRDTYDRESPSASYAWSDEALNSSISINRIGNVLHTSEEKFKKTLWGIEEEYTLESHPELYI